MLNISDPSTCFEDQFIPNDGVALVRLEFIISQMGIHPLAALQYDSLPWQLRSAIDRHLEQHAPFHLRSNPVEFYVHTICEAVATIAAAFWPKPVVVRLTDFKSNEYRNLLGGNLFEPQENNPMLGLRGAAR
jgi:pyruvate,water dikinase